jgi:hypothetical protein
MCTQRWMVRRERAAGWCGVYQARRAMRCDVGGRAGGLHGGLLQNVLLGGCRGRNRSAPRAIGMRDMFTLLAVNQLSLELTARSRITRGEPLHGPPLGGALESRASDVTHNLQLL